MYQPRNKRKKVTGYIGPCPFHRDPSPSLRLYKMTNGNKGTWYYKCFGCGKAGDVFKFVMEYDHVTFKEAFEIIQKLRWDKRRKFVHPSQLEIKFEENLFVKKEKRKTNIFSDKKEFAKVIKERNEKLYPKLPPRPRPSKDDLRSPF